jgi:hypothetical protein
MDTKPSARPSVPIVLGLVLTATLVACAVVPSTTPGPDPTPSPPSSIPQPSGDPGSASPALPSDIAAATRFRQEFGLRSDEAWVRAVAADREAVLDYGVPLLPFERAEIEGRATGDDAVVEAARRYLDSHADISGGIYIDQARGGIVTALVTERPDVHEAATRALIAGAARVAVHQDFLAGLPARMTSASVDLAGNRVDVAISSAVPDAAQRIATHHGARPDQLAVRSDGTGMLLMPTGRIVGRIVAPAGTDMGTLSPQSEADVDIGPRDAVGIEVDRDGTFTMLGMPPTTYTVTVLLLGEEDRRVVGSARVTVPPGGVGAVEIPVRLP